MTVYTELCRESLDKLLRYISLITITTFYQILYQCFDKCVLYTCLGLHTYNGIARSRREMQAHLSPLVPYLKVSSINDIAYENLDAITKRPVQCKRNVCERPALHVRLCQRILE